MTDLYETFQHQACVIQNEMEKANFTSLGIGEESLTDLVLNDIASKHDNFVYTKKFSHKQEANLSGADWLWCIGEPGYWITFAVQAKIESIGTKRISYLHYKKGEQYSQLIKFCNKFGILPKYSLYSFIDEDEFFCYPFLREVDPIQWSFSAISPKHIKLLRQPKETHVSRVRPYSLPWSYIFASNSNREEPLAITVANNLSRAYWPMENHHRIERGQRETSNYKKIQWENPQPDRLVTENIPMLALYLLTSKKRHHIKPVSQVSMISSIPATPALEFEIEKVSKKLSWKRYESTYKKTLLSLLDRETCYLLKYDDYRR